MMIRVILLLLLRIITKISKIQCNSLHIGNSVINLKFSVRNLSIQFDSKMSMSPHVNLACRDLFWQIRNINSVRKAMSDKVTASIIHSYILSRLDYGNTLLINANCDQIVTLYRVQNAAARILIKKIKKNHTHNACSKTTSLVARCGED